MLSPVSEAHHPVNVAEVRSMSHVPQAVVIRLVGSLVSELLVLEVLVKRIHFGCVFCKLFYRPELFFLGVEESLFGSETRLHFVITQVHSEVDFRLASTLPNEVGALAAVTSVVNVNVGSSSH